MAIKVNGTTVINDSRSLTNIASVDATTAASIVAAGVGGVGLPPTLNFNSPTVTLTSSGTWTIPGSIGLDDFIMFYLVGGGGTGRRDGANPQGGQGGAGVFIRLIRRSLPSSIPYTIGAGGVVPGGSSSYGSTASGGDTSITINGKSYSAKGGGGGTNNNNTSRRLGYTKIVSSGDILELAGMMDGGTTAYSPATDTENGMSWYDSMFGGAAGGTYVNYVGGFGPGTSTYAGNGGNGGTQSGAFGNGYVPGGGGGGTTAGAGNGGNGSLRIYY